MAKLDNSKPNRRFTNARAAARSASKEWTITFDEYTEITKQNRCYYCRVDFGKLTGSCLDRVDSNLGYHVDNVVPCCRRCNMLKSNEFTEAETKFMVLALKIFRRYKD